MSPKSLALIPVLLAGVLLTAGQAAPVPRPKPSKLAILYAPDCNLADWLLIDADGTNPRPFLRPDGKREPIVVLPGQRPVVVSRVPEDTLTLLHPSGGDITIALNESPMLEVWRAWRWKFARDRVEIASDNPTVSNIEDALCCLLNAIGPLTPDDVEPYSRMMWLESVSPDGTRVAFSGTFCGAYILDLSAKKVIDLDQVVHKPKGSETDHFRLSPDWSWLEYHAYSDSTVPSKCAIYIARLDGTCQTRVSDGIDAGIRMDTLPQWQGWLGRDQADKLKAKDWVVDPDGTVAILAREEKEDAPWRISIYDIRTKRETALPAGFGHRDRRDFRWVRVPADRD